MKQIKLISIILVMVLLFSGCSNLPQEIPKLTNNSTQVQDTPKGESCIKVLDNGTEQTFYGDDCIISIELK